MSHPTATVSSPATASSAPVAEPAPVIEIIGLSKRYDSGFEALKQVDLEIRRGEIFALLGPNGAGKTTLISIICGLVNASAGQVLVDGHDNVSAYRAARAKIGLVPQELTSDAFETVWNTVRFSRGLFGRKPDDAHIERVLKSLSLWDKRKNKLITLSGGMKRRVLIAKALAHEPEILFLDEPTAGVDVALRRDMWEVVRELRASGVTIILTTHYIEEAEEMADRIGVINGGEIVLVREKQALMRQLGSKQLTLQLQQPLASVPPALSHYPLALDEGGSVLVYTYDASDPNAQGQVPISTLLNDIEAAGIRFKDLHTKQSSLEEIFVKLVRERQ
ncbi:ABC transporter ATP-binding protein [Salinicola endophyticus]|uniref:ABC transporter ATP-binding protein n=1 Tax=Salinicola endophyticus TaxID=1949083 RepID=A0ABY8FH40_9GAMM|nr:ABC transporter ATP-binding protein [Salinicola endophyticus]WFF42108.1 ABC transporter ATP-binding protein [Salinicola endophyticus]